MNELQEVHKSFISIKEKFSLLFHELKMTRERYFRGIGEFRRDRNVWSQKNLGGLSDLHFQIGLIDVESEKLLMRVDQIRVKDGEDPAVVRAHRKELVKAIQTFLDEPVTLAKTKAKEIRDYYESLKPR